jgi:hypothetical protein
MGIDVGFSMTRRTTGIACLKDDQRSLKLRRNRMEKPRGTNPKWLSPPVIAIDGPLLPLGTDQLIRRHVELVFIRAPFRNRCRLGLSHHGVGLELRSASVKLALNSVVSSHPRCWRRSVPFAAKDPLWKLFQMPFWAC